MQSDTVELKLLKQLYRQVISQRLYRTFIKKAIDSNNPEIHIQFISYFYNDLKYKKLELDIEVENKLKNDVIEFVETNPSIFQKKS